MYTGVGKSKLLTVLRKHLSPETTATTASTGCAAVLLGAGATTLHSAMGVQLGDKPASVYIKRMLKTFMPSFEADADRHLVPIRDQLHRDRVERVIKLRTLIIDEVSMISGNFLDLIGEVVRAIREFARQVPAFSKYPVGNRHDVPFGNLQLVFCGDFLQLEAVQAIQQGMAFNSKAWRALAPRVHNLTTVHRQGDGSEFAQLLQRVRIGQATEEDVQRIHFLSSTLVSRRAVYLCPLTSQVEEINNRRLGELLQRAGVPVVRLHAVEVRGAHLNRSPRYAFSNDEAHRWPHSAELQLAVGARVMCTRNVGDELVNGSTGMVKQLTATTIVVEFDGAIGGGGKPFEHTFTIPTVNNVGNRTLQESVYKHAIADPNDPTKERVARWQVPLILAWAITVHKSQGATLDRAVISFEGMFANGQAYTALSRMRALTGLTVKGLTLTKLQKVNTKTIEWYTQHK